MPSSAYQIFHSFTSDGWSRVEDALARREAESLFIDFKRKASPDTIDLNKDDRRNLGAALSGFANSEGGVIVWGMETEKSRGHDVAIAVQPLREVDGVLRELVRLTPELASPPVEGVKHLPILNGEESKAGVIATLVPQSDSTPHMARGPSQQRYYRRTDAGFRPMEHYEVADLFGRRPHPALAMDVRWRARLHSSGGGRATARLAVEFVLLNQGRGIATFPSLTLATPEGYSPSDWTGKHGGKLVLPRVRPPRGWWQRYSGGGDIVIYPEDELSIATVNFDLSNRRTAFPNLELRYRVIAAEAMPVGGDVHIGGEEIREAIAAALEAGGFTLQP